MKIHAEVNFIRILSYIDNLREITGMGWSPFDRMVRSAFYTPMGLTGPSEETVKKYFDGERMPEYDPPNNLGPSWVEVVEMLIPGSSWQLFHPLWNLLDGPLRSSKKLRQRLIEAAVDSALAPIGSKVETYSLREKRALSKWALVSHESTTPLFHNHRVEMSRIHQCMLMLPFDHWRPFFRHLSLGTDIQRHYRAAEIESQDAQRFGGLEGAALIVALVLEAQELGDAHRLHHLRRALVGAGAAMEEMPLLQRTLPKLTRVLVERCCTRSASRLDYEKAFQDGFPEYWADFSRLRANQTLLQLVAAEDELSSEESFQRIENCNFVARFEAP